MGTFKDNVVLITGASTGIGEELACRLADQGARLVLAARRLPELERVAARVRARGASAIVVACDVSKHEDCKHAVAEAVREFGRLDTLVVNAGATMWAKFENIEDPSILDRLMQVNYMGAVYCTHAALPHLKVSHGRIVGVASLTALTGVPTRTGYAASKHAMRGFYDSLRIELEESGVTVTMIYPGFVATGIRENATGADGKAAKIDPVNQDDVMSVEECVALILPAMANRRRELIMTLKGKFGPWLKLIAPGLVDRLAKKAVEGNEKYVGPT
jgi:NAD(P)-dependent dehydrogenase (short-subunit alcohol dehydrogenase family)